VEDSLLGIQAGIHAGMKVIGITTTHQSEELTLPHLIIDNFYEVDYHKIVDLLQLV
jgi:sugar-phosphatase